LIFGCDDSLDRCEIALAERVVLLAIKAFPPSVGLSGIDPVVHDAPADEPRYLLISIPPVKQQSITIVRAGVDSKLRKFHGLFLLRASRHAPFAIHWSYAHSMPISRLMMVGIDIRTLLLNVRVGSLREAGN
jgi:hypothetical protein